MRDPFDVITALGYRVVWIKDFDMRVALVDDLRVALIDPRVARSDAASVLLSLIVSTETYDGTLEAS